MNEFVQAFVANSLFFGVVITLLTYQFGMFLKNKFKLAIFNPIVVSIVCIIVVLVAFEIDVADYTAGAQYINYLLTPATVCLAVPLYEKVALLKKHMIAILVGIFSGVLSSAVSILLMSMAFGLGHTEYVTLLPKSITTAIGIGLSEEYGGIVTITVAAIVITGNLGNMIAEFICRVCRIEEPIAKGIAIGTSSHAAGTAKAIEMGDVEGAMSGLSIAVSGLMTVVISMIFVNLW